MLEVSLFDRKCKIQTLGDIKWKYSRPLGIIILLILNIDSPEGHIFTHTDDWPLQIYMHIFYKPLDFISFSVFLQDFIYFFMFGVILGILKQTEGLQYILIITDYWQGLNIEEDDFPTPPEIYTYGLIKNHVNWATNGQVSAHTECCA